MNGPFQTERAMTNNAPYGLRRRTIRRSVFLLERVRLPLVGLPQGVTGDGHLMCDLPLHHAGDQSGS